jgi:hypothetical protein
LVVLKQLIMEDLTPLQHLDYVLNGTLGEKDYFNLKETLLADNSLPTDEHYIKMLLNKLRVDGYVDFIAGERFVTGQQVGEGMSIRQNFNGRLFLLDGGYEGKYKNEVAKITAQSAATDRAEKYAKWLTLWTKCLFFGTLALVLVEALIEREHLISLFYSH